MPTTRSCGCARWAARIAGGLAGLGAVQPGLRVGLGANELRHLQRVDFAVNPKASQFGPFGVLAVRHGKAMRASTRNGAAS
jgi:hypothetical protein